MINPDIAKFKQQTAERAVEFVESGMVVGLGTGSTTLFALRSIAQLLDAGQLKDIIGIPSSVQTEEEALRLGIPLTTLEEHPVIDLTIDGADEFDPYLILIKGGGGALLREKILAQASNREIIIVDESKLSPQLGTRWSVPVEVIPFGWRPVSVYMESLGASVTLRRNIDDSLFKTDQDNLIIDCNFGAISQPDQLAVKLNQQAGVIENGLFIGLATEVIVAGDKGINYLKR
jgi:ribose 5-phosphate isomerase A